MKNEFIEELCRLNGSLVEIETQHIWFGLQKIICLFSFVNDDDCMGFSVNGKKIFLLKKEVIMSNKIDNEYYIGDGMMVIKIHKI